MIEFLLGMVIVHKRQSGKKEIVSSYVIDLEIGIFSPFTDIGRLLDSIDQLIPRVDCRSTIDECLEELMLMATSSISSAHVIVMHSCIPSSS